MRALVAVFVWIAIKAAPFCWEKIEPMQFYELNSSRMDYRELSADDLDLLTPLLRSEETMQTLL